MSLNSSTVKPSTSPRQQTESNLSAAPKKGTTAVHDQSQAEQSKPILSNRAANHSSTYIADELNRSNTPIVEHSDPEKNDRNAETHSKAPTATSDNYLERIKELALAGNIKAMFTLSLRYDKEDGIEENKKKSFMWCLRAAELAYAPAQFNVAVMYDFGEGVEVNKAEALMWYQRSALLGNWNAQRNLGIIYLTGDGVDVDKEKSFSWFHKAAKQGDFESQYEVAIMYEKGKGVELDKVKAFSWMLRAAEQGHTKALFNLGTFYDNGEGVEVNKKKAFALYHKAALQGHVNAQFNLGLMYNDGEGVKADKEKAFSLFVKLAKQGDLEAQYQVAQLYAKGEGVKEDKEKAFILYQNSAEQGHLGAMESLCGAYKAGHGVEKNLALATYWMMRWLLISGNKKIMFTAEPELFEFIPGAITNFPEFQELKSITYNSGEFFWKQDVAAVDKFIRSNSSVENLKIITNISSINNDQFATLTEALKFNTQLIRLEFDGSKPSKEMAGQIEVLLTQNRNIAALRQYVKKHPLIYSAGFPLDIVPIILDEMIVANLKGGHTKEATQNAIDTFLLGVSVKELQEDSKI